MRTFTLSHSFDCEPDALWLTFFDQAFTAAQFAALGFGYELLEQRDEEAKVTRSIRVTPKLDVPGPVAKVIGSSFAYREDGTFDKATKTWTWKSTTSTLANKIHSEGKVRIVADGPGKCIRKSDFTIEVNLLGLGGLVESALEKNFTQGWDGSAAFTAKWLKEHVASP
jgi:hypothetical protein